ncbi:hypothetical protein SAMN05443245_2352 [Paraburkholderia fungorum]|uniref:Lipoprotein n=1 Tax=Paraburkholderia fungorum TaxID=134537 RepID=A0A1H1CWU2_9BURK|nr:hypothetical protein [Paraburkholderia fungorum]SDQ68684.1 hypothetical protein SAMN05443245_2352 [Paraburkholderia fungorum]
MKIRILSIACITAAVALLAACTATFRNSDACEQLMRGKLADTSADTLKVAHRGAGIHGSRVVIEGSIEHVTTASEAAATAASAHGASGVSATRASGVGVASAVSATSPASAVSVDASAASSASEAKSVSTKPAKPTTVVTATAAECTFHGPDLNVFRWLAPAKLVTPADEAASATSG